MKTIKFFLFLIIALLLIYCTGNERQINEIHDLENINKKIEKDIKYEEPKLSELMKHKLDSVYSYIKKQHDLYKKLNTLEGMERIQAANAVVFGYTRLENDLIFFDTYAPINDRRRDTIAILLNYINSKEGKNLSPVRPF